MRALLVIIFAVAILIGWLAGGSRADADRTASAAPASTKPQADHRTAAARDTVYQPERDGTLELRREGNGHFFVRGDIAGRHIRFVVDTGASVVAIGREDARQLGFHPQPADFDITLGTASGTIRGARITIPRIRTGDIELNDVPAVVLDIPDTQPMLGQSFLSRLDRVSIEGDRMLLVKG